ncbi:hypothetical protein [Actinoplanes sp. NPDC026619]|uniref:hypothetical protein n=1 Tax=Actinoplanes sp. NPDC026619 TaxID=3155798 RepID=UPI0033F8DDCB
MEPTDALRSIEVALRLLIVEVLGDFWQECKGSPDMDNIKSRREEEAKRRDGVSVSRSLIDYTETYHLTNIIEKNWDKFQPALTDRNRTFAYFGIIADVRNSIAHSRELVPFERDLISGVAGQLRNQISKFRSERASAGRYYPLIETVRDDRGNEGADMTLGSLTSIMRLSVGETISFEGSAVSARGKSLRWYFCRGFSHPMNGPTSKSTVELAEGTSVQFSYTVSEEDVGESFYLYLMLVGESRYHREMRNINPFDDYRAFVYSINPPDDE